MVRLLLLLLGTLGTNRPPRQRPPRYPDPAREPVAPGGTRYARGPVAPDLTRPLRPWPGGPDPGAVFADHGRPAPHPGPGRRRRFPRWLGWAAVAAVVGVIFRRAVASLAVAALSGALHLVGINVHLAHIRFGWPWQTLTSGTTTNTDPGPWVLQKIEGISRPALGQANFDFMFTHKVSRNVGPLPCWYASTFYALGHAAATVDLNPGPGWWAASTQHYRLRVIAAPTAGRPGRLAVTMVLPQPQLPQSAHDVTIDNLPSKPVASQHSWTYPGLGCGVVIRPQFPQSVLYAQAQRIAFYKSRHSPQLTRSLISKAETQAEQTIRNNFIQPTVNALGYRLDRLTIRWVTGPS